MKAPYVFNPHEADAINTAILANARMLNDTTVGDLPAALYSILDEITEFDFTTDGERYDQAFDIAIGILFYAPCRNPSAN